MSMLTTLARYKTAFGLTSVDPVRDGKLTALILSVSSEVEAYLSRTLALTTHKAWLDAPVQSWLDGTEPKYLLLPNWPIKSVMAVCPSVRECARLENSTAIQATVFSDSEKMTLFSISDTGAEHEDVILFSEAATISALGLAISNAGGGWRLSIAPGQGVWPSTYIKPVSGHSGVNGDDVVVAVAADPMKVVVSQTVQGALRIGAGFTVSTWQATGSDADTVFVHYRAGYTLPADNGTFDFPLDLERAVQEIVRQAFDSSAEHIGVFQSESVAGYSYSLSPDARNIVSGAISAMSRTLTPYKRF
jgi:hypothetical protein